MASSAVGNIHINLLVSTGQTRAFTSAANVIGRDSNRMRQALGGTTRSVQTLRSTMNQGWRSRIFSDMIRQASQTNNEVAKLRATMMGVAALTGTSLSGAFAGTFLLQTADQANRLNNQLRTVADNEENLIAIRERLYAVSQLTRSDMAATVTLYARISRAAKEFGKSQEDIVKVTETIQKAFAIGGASQAEASGAAIQLSQGIASDRFSGEEYRSVAENAPVLLQQMAKHLGVNIGKLREMAHAGELTGKVVTDAILGASAAIDTDFNKTIVTVGQSLTQVGNAFMMYIGDVDSSIGVTQRLSTALSNLAENMDSIAPFLSGAAGLGLAAFGGRAISGAISGRVGNFQEIRREQRETLDGLVKQKAAVDAQIASNKANLALQRQQHAAIVASGHAVGVTAKQRHDASLREAASLKEIIALRQRSLVLSQQQVAVIGQVAVAQRRATVAMAAMAMAQRAGSGMLGLLGGWTGVAFAAAIAGMGVYAANAAKAEERTRKLTKELHTLGLISDEVAGITDATAESLSDLGASAIRNKLREVADELERMKAAQNALDIVFNYDPSTLGNMLAQLDAASKTVLRGDFTFGSKLSDSDQAAADEIRAIIVAAQEGSSTLEGLQARLETLSTSNPDMAPFLDGMIENLKLALPYMDGLLTRHEQLQAQLQAMNDSGISTGWIENLQAQQESLEATQSAADALRAMAEAQIEQIGLSERERDIREVINDLREEAIELGHEESSLQEAVLRQQAEAIVAAQERADAQQDFNDKVADFSTEIGEAASSFEDMQAAATLERLLEDFATGTVSAETLRTRLAEINSVNLTDPMNALIGRIIAAIGPLATLLGIFNSFGGAAGGSPLGGPLPGPVHSRGALGRSRRELAAKKEIGQEVLDQAVADAGMSERDAWVKDKTEELKRQAEALGGVASNAEATAAELWDMDQAQEAATKSGKSAADAAEKYAEGMAELRREVAAAPLSDFEREVLSSAESMGIAADELDAFVAAVSSGGLDAAPAKFREIASAMQEIKTIGLMQDLEFERDQIFRSETDQRIYETLRDTGLELNSVQGRMIADQIRFNEVSKTGMDLIKSGADAAVDAWRDGKLELSEVLNIVTSLVTQMLKMPGVMDGIGSFFGNLLGGGNFMGGTPGAPALQLGYQAGVPGYSSGTNFHPGGLARINEMGGEILDLPRGTRVIPHDVSMAMASAQNNTPVVLKPETHIHPPQGYEAQTEESQGGMRQDVYFKRAVAGAIGSPGPAQNAVARTGALTRR